MGKRIVYFLLGFAITACGGNSTAPTVTSFTLNSKTPTARAKITFTLTATDDDTDSSGIKYLVTTSSEKPTKGTDGWQDSAPTTYTLTGDKGDKTIYAYAMDKHGNVSEASTVAVKWVTPGSRDTDNWDLKVNTGGSNNELVWSIAVDSSDNVYVVGAGSNVVGSNTGYDVLIKKYDSSGTEVTSGWDKAIDYNQGDDMAKDIAIDSGGNFYVVGKAENAVNASSDDDCFIKKYDKDGNEITTGWNKVFDGSGASDTLIAVAVDSSDNVIVGGSGTDLLGVGTDTDLWIIKYDSSGNQLWEKKIDNGVSGSDDVSDIVIDSSDNIYMVGSGEDLVSTCPSSGSDWWIKKYDSGGNQLWEKKVDYGNASNTILSADIDSNGNLYVAGVGENLVDSTSDTDVWLRKYSSDGTEDTSWEKKIDMDHRDDFPVRLIVGSDGNIYVGCYFTSSTGTTFVIKKYDSSGSEDSDWNSFVVVSQPYEILAGMGFNGWGDLFVGIQDLNLVSSSSGADWWIMKVLNKD